LTDDASVWKKHKRCGYSHQKKGSRKKKESQDASEKDAALRATPRKEQNLEAEEPFTNRSMSGAKGHEKKTYNWNWENGVAIPGKERRRRVGRSLRTAGKAVFFSEGSGRPFPRG